jgi:hypothetical protein
LLSLVNTEFDCRIIKFNEYVSDFRILIVRMKYDLGVFCNVGMQIIRITTIQSIAHVIYYKCIISFTFRMAQKTIAEIEEMSSSRPTPYSGSLMAKVIKIGHVAKFKNSNGEDAELINFSLADKSGAILASCTGKDRMIQEGKTLLIRDFIIKNGKVAMSHKTKIMAKASMSIPDSVVQRAVYLILPPSPLKKVEELLTLPPKTISTVQGQLSKV